MIHLFRIIEYIPSSKIIISYNCEIDKDYGVLNRQNYVHGYKNIMLNNLPTRNAVNNDEISSMRSTSNKMYCILKTICYFANEILRFGVVAIQ